MAVIVYRLLFGNSFVLDYISDRSLAAFHNAPVVLTIHVCSICGEIAVAVGLVLLGLCRRDGSGGGRESVRLSYVSD